jgi:hypothetical protein
VESALTNHPLMIWWRFHFIVSVIKINPMPREINPPGINLFKYKLLIRIITPNRQNNTPKNTFNRLFILMDFPFFS